MRFSQIQTINDFNLYITDCKVVPHSRYSRFGKDKESSHSMQSLVYKLQCLVQEVRLLPPQSLGIALDGKVIIQAGISDLEQTALFKTVNDLLAINAKLNELQTIAVQTKSKGFRAKMSRCITRIALHSRFGRQPAPSKLLAKIAVMMKQKFRQDVRNTEQSPELMREAKILIGGSLNKLQVIAANAFSTKSAIPMPAEEEPPQNVSSSSEDSFPVLLEISEPPKHEAPWPISRPPSHLLRTGEERTFNRRASNKRQSKKPTPKPNTNRPSSILLRSQISTLKALDEAAKQGHSPIKTAWERVIGGQLDERRSRIKDSSPIEDSFSFSATSSQSWSAELPE